MENQVFKLLEKSEISPLLLNVIEGDVLPSDPTAGELIFLASYLPKERYPEMLPYLSELPHYILVNMFAVYDEEEPRTFEAAMLSEIKKRSETFNQKLSLLGFIDEEEDPDYFQSLFMEVVDMCQDFDDCMSVMREIAFEPKEIELVLEKMRMFNLSFDDWSMLQEEAPNHDARIESLKEMISIAEKDQNKTLWLTIYKHCLSGSQYEKIALAAIASFNLTSEDWLEIYQNCDRLDDYRIINLAIKNLQQLNADFKIWLVLLDADLSDFPIDPSDNPEKYAPNPIILGMLLESKTATVEGLYCMYEYLYEFPHLQIAVMQNMMSLADAK